MIGAHSFEILLPSDADTDRLGQVMAPCLTNGDCLLLSGTLGAGKSHLARAIIRERLDRFEDVPSPTFTLVQTYDSPSGEIWHADLYRLTHPDEVFELGLMDAFNSAICLVEWPDRLGRYAPPDAISVHLHLLEKGRKAELSFEGRADLAKALAEFADG